MNYSYEIIKVDAQARVMEVVYSSAGRQSMHIGARLPYEGESLRAVIESYAPISYWLEQEAPIVVPEVGTSGVIEVDLSLRCELSANPNEVVL